MTVSEPEHFISFNQVSETVPEIGLLERHGQLQWKENCTVGCKLPLMQDGTCISVANKDGIFLFSLESNKIVYSARLGSMKMVQMLHSTSLLAYVGSGEMLKATYGPVIRLHISHAI